MKVFFNRLTGERGLSPYGHQEKVFRYLREGKNIFLRAPTGSGKTMAALLPFIFAKQQGIEIADRLIYVLPLRTLATSLYNEAHTACSNIFEVRSYPEDRRKKEELLITIQTGETKNDPFFEGEIIFTTVDQLLSSYINMPVSLPRRVGNINAGALLGSVIVFDEFHLLDSDKAMKTAIEMMERLKPFSQFIIMTATLSSKSLSIIRDDLGGEIISLSPDEVKSLPSHKDKKRTYKWVKGPLKADDIIDNHNGGRSIVIVNTVSKAQDLFIELKDKLKNKDTPILLLHSRFYNEDRKRIEGQLKKYFGKDAAWTDVILVTTQVIEAGIDISADVLHTELAPLNSIIQRAGRCARYEGERGVGTVFIYDLERNEKGEPRLGPYRGRENAEIIENSRKVLERLSLDGEIIGFDKETFFIDEVHTKYEDRSLSDFQWQYAFKEKVLKAIDGRNDTAVRELIRDSFSISVIISGAPEELEFNKEKWPRMISVPRPSLLRLVPLIETHRDFDTVAWMPDDNISDENEFCFKWTPVSNKDQLYTLPWLIVISPEFASYDPELGLRIGTPGVNIGTEYVERPAFRSYVIRFETFREHLIKTVEEYSNMDHMYKKAVEKLGAYYDLTVEEIERLALLACLLHDTGKISREWQESAKIWQGHKDGSKMLGEPLAHTDYDPASDFEEKKKLRIKKVDHAAEGAFSVWRWLEEKVGQDNALVIASAIARHHGAKEGRLDSFKFGDGTAELLSGTHDFLKGIYLDDSPGFIDRQEFGKYLFQAVRDERWPLYAFVVRQLRLADQKSQKGGG